MGQSATKEVGSQKYTLDRKTLYNKSFSITVKDIQIFKGTIILSQNEDRIKKTWLYYRRFGKSAFVNKFVIKEW